MMGSVFAMQGIGQFAAAMVSLIVTEAYKSTLEQAETVDKCTGACGLAVDKMWRIVIGFGAVPGCIALYYRLTIPETPRYTFDVDRDVIQAGSDVKAFKAGMRRGHVDEITRARAKDSDAHQLEVPTASWSDFFHWIGKWKNGRVLLGTASSWFLLDVAYYGTALRVPNDYAH
jgi:PHS family inorganic phosphate transporter-like MFS transporter